MVKKGDYVKFGNYFQSNDTTKEPVEWLVIDENQDEVLLISKYVLDAQAYNTNRVNIT